MAPKKRTFPLVATLVLACGCAGSPLSKNTSGAFDASPGHEPGSVRALVDAGLEFLQKGDSERARQMFDRAEAKLQADTGEKGTPVLVLPATDGEVERGVEYFDFTLREKLGVPGNPAILFPENKVGHVLLEPRGEGWVPLRWLGRQPFYSESGAIGRFDEAGILWITRPDEERDIRIGAYNRGSLSPDGRRLFACNAKESVFLALPEGKEIGRRSSGCVGRDLDWHIQWNKAGTLLFEGEWQDKPYNNDALKLVASAVPSFETVFDDDRTVAYKIHDPSGRFFVKRRVEGETMELVVFDAREKKVLAKRQEKFIGDARFSPDGSKIALVGEKNTIFVIKTGGVEDFGPTHTVNVRMRAKPAHFTSDGRYCLNRNSKWRLDRSAPRPDHAEYCFPHEDGSASTAQIPITKGFVQPSDKWEGNDFLITEALSPDRKTAAIVELAEEPPPAAGAYVPPDHFLVFVDVLNAAILRRIPLGRFYASGNGTFVLGPVFSKDGKVVTVPTGENEAGGFYVESGRRAPAENTSNPHQRPLAPRQIAIAGHALTPVRVKFEGNRALFLDTDASTARLWDLAQATELRAVREPGLWFAEFAGDDFGFATCDMKTAPWRSTVVLHSAAASGEIAVPVEGIVIAMREDLVATATKEEMTILERKGDRLRELQRMPFGFGEVLFSAHGDHLVFSGIGFGGPGGLTVLEIPGGGLRYQSAENECLELRLRPGDVIQCGLELFDLGGAPVKRPPGSPPIVLQVDYHGDKMIVDEGGGKPVTRPLDSFLWIESQRYITGWSESEDGKHLFVGHNRGIVTVHAMADGARLVTLVPTTKGGVAFLPGGYVEVFGEPPPNLVCRFGAVLVPFQVCAGHRTVNRGMARTIAGDLPL